MDVSTRVSVEALACGLLLWSWVDSRPAVADVPVVTRSYDNRRTGANTNEAALRPANVGGLHKLREIALDAGDDPRIEAQPLYAPAVHFPDGTTHNLLIVCTMANNVYAFDTASGAKVWKRPLGPPVHPAPTGNKTPDGRQPTEIDTWGINGAWGVLSTPVLDLPGQTIYVANWTSATGKPADATFDLQAVDLVAGTISRKVPIGASTGAAKFDPHLQKQRSALLLVGNTIFLACGLTHEDAQGHHGWLLAFDKATLHRTAAWCTTKRSQGGGIWQAGQGPAADANGFIYLMTGNGGYDGKTDFSESLVKLKYTPPASATAKGSLTIVDWFTPFKDAARAKVTGNGYDFHDQDLGSAGPIIPTGSFVVGAGKDGVLYVLDRGHLGKILVDPAKPNLANYQPALKSALFFTYFAGFDLNPLEVHDLDTMPTAHTHHLHGSAVTWDSRGHGTMLFVWGENASLRAWSLPNGGTPQFLAESQETASAFANTFDAMPGGMLTLSSNGADDGIVWGIVPIKGIWQNTQNQGDANKEIVEGVVRAYDASVFGPPPPTSPNASLKLLWQSTAPGNPQPGQTRFTYNKFCPPVVADGKLFVTTYDGRVLIYGL
jgi:outer membrane protein assembly factor BamB